MSVGTASASPGEIVDLPIGFQQGADDGQDGGADEIAALALTVAIPGLQLASCDNLTSDGLTDAISIPDASPGYRVVIENTSFYQQGLLRDSYLCPDERQVRSDYINILAFRSSPTPGSTVQALPSGTLFRIRLRTNEQPYSGTALHIFTKVDNPTELVPPQFGGYFSVGDIAGADRTANWITGASNVRTVDGAVIIAPNEPHLITPRPSESVPEVPIFPDGHIPGDGNCDHEVSAADVPALLRSLPANPPLPPGWCRGLDSSGNMFPGLEDIPYLAHWVFQQVPARAVHMTVADAVGFPGTITTLVVSLTRPGFDVAATANDLIFDPERFVIEPAGCRVNSRIGKTLIASTVRPGVLRVFVQAGNDTSPIPNGLLYTCDVRIGASVLPGAYPVEVDGFLSFDAQGQEIGRVATEGGDIAVTLVLPTPTMSTTPSSPSLTPTFTATPSGTAANLSSATPSRTATVASSPTGTPPAVATASISPTATFVSSATPTAKPSVTFTTIPSSTTEPTLSPAPLPSPTPLQSESPEATAEATRAATATPILSASCLGDCNGDHAVTVDEIVRGLNIALGHEPFGTCPAVACRGEQGGALNCMVAVIETMQVGCEEGTGNASAPK